jgi:hypothetical protein
MILTLLLIAYLVGVGVTLAPTIKTNWNTAPASQFAQRIGEELPEALSWPATAFRNAREKPAAPAKSDAAD